jgi:predicted metal-dependent peptidase
MVLSDEKVKEYMKRLLMSRLRILVNNGFYGLLLMHMIFSLDEKCTTAATDGKRIFFGPTFLDDLSDSELDFIMMHEILHVVLQHCFRGEAYDQERFNIACDIVVNSNIMESNNSDPLSITLKKYGESIHKAPDGSEGWEYTAEEVYQMLSSAPSKGKSNHKSGSSEGMSGLTVDGDGSGDGDDSGDSEGLSGGGKPGKGECKGSALGRAKQEQCEKNDQPGVWDDHTRWGMEEEDDTLRDVWVKRTLDAAEVISIRDPSNQRGLLPMFAERLIGELKKPQTDWRTILNDFIQEEIVDYSFTPPDRRFDESPFFLPDFNDKDNVVKDILFMIDTSGSMSDDMITAAYSEVKGAIDQFGGKLKGWLGFFDAAIIEPKPFENEDEFKIIRPKGGGGTDFQIIFEYVQKHMNDNLPASIIIMTDGFAPFPKEHLAMGIPVLWLLNNDQVDPPWGKIARIVV